MGNDKLKWYIYRVSWSIVGSTPTISPLNYINMETVKKKAKKKKAKGKKIIKRLDKIIALMEGKKD